MLEFITVFAVSYVLHAMGVTIGYHRLLSHRSFNCNKATEYFWVLMGYLAFEGSPIWWATIHRAHHKWVDTPLDPHSPRNSLQYSHTGWLMEKKYLPHVDPALQSKDLLTDPIYQFLEQGGNFQRAHGMGFAFCFAFRAVLWAVFGWQVALASLLAAFAVMQIPLMLNVVCHIPKLGYKNYRCDDDSVNVWWVGLLAMGEGWHNNHHASPGSARSGMRPWEFDASWHVIKLMERFGWVTRINEVSDEAIVRKLGAAEARKIQLTPSRVVAEVSHVAAEVKAALEPLTPATELVGAASSRKLFSSNQTDRTLIHH